MAAPVYFTVPQNYAGSTLQQIQQGVNLPGIGAPKVTDNTFLGINPNQPLTAGQQLQYASNDPGYLNSGQYMSASQLFGAPVSDAQYQAQQANDFQIKANQPAIAATGSAITNTQGAFGSAVSQYQSEIPNIQNQYQDVLNQITRGINSQYAKRGLSSNSPQMSLDNATAQLPAANQQTNALNQFLNSIAGLQTGGAQSVGNLQQVLGGLQSGNPLASLQYGQSQAMLPYQQAQAQANSALANAQAVASQYIPVPSLGVYNSLNQSLLGQYGYAPAATYGAGNGKITYQ